MTTSAPVNPATTPGGDARVARPDSVPAAAQLLRDSSGPLLFRGGGTKLGWGARPTPPAVVVDTSALSRLISHNAGDMTAAVQAGMPLSRLQEQLAPAGQWLALDPPTEPAGATVGGLLATGDFGPRRLRYGGMRDLVIGVTLVLADGTVAHSGGHVIKNVAGYDLARLVGGSLGSLALVAEVVLRLHPRPETTLTLTAPASLDRATAVSLGLLASPLEPCAVTYVGSPAGGAADSSLGRLAVRFEGSPVGVRAQADSLRAALLGAGLDPTELTGEPEQALWREIGTELAGSPGETVACAGTVPSRTNFLGDALARAAATAGVEATLAGHPALGLHVARFRGDPDGQARAFDAWRRELLGRGASVLLRDRPDAVEVAVDAVGPPPSAASLLQAVKRALDPADRCAPGRFGSWY